MTRFAFALVAISFSSSAYAQSVTLPAEIKGAPGTWIIVTPDAVDGGAVKWRIDPLLQEVRLDRLFPGMEPKGKVVTGPAGTYKVEAWNAKGDVASDIATVLIKIGDVAPIVPPPPKDPKEPLPPPVTSSLYFLIVRPDGPASPAFSKIMADAAWSDVTKAGHVFKDKTQSAASVVLGVTLPAGTVLPVVVPLQVAADGKSSTQVGDPVPLPTTSEGIRKLIPSK